MASIIKTSINLNHIDKTKIIQGKKGKYFPITITLNDEPDQFGNNGPVCIAQTKEEREAKLRYVQADAEANRIENEKKRDSAQKDEEQIEGETVAEIDMLKEEMKLL